MNKWQSTIYGGLMIVDGLATLLSFGYVWLRWSDKWLFWANIHNLKKEINERD